MRRPAIERLLPAAYQRAAAQGGVLTALLDVMETLHAPSEAVLSTVEDQFSPYRAADGMVPFLLGWVAQDHIAAGYRAGVPAAADAIAIGRLRNLLAEGASLAQWRGTAFGLRRTLEIATGVRGFAVGESPDRAFHVVVRIPPEAADRQSLVRRIVELEKPAAVTVEVVVAAPTDEEQPS
jgi:phage tail-like protein